MCLSELRCPVARFVPRFRKTGEIGNPQDSWLIFQCQRNLKDHIKPGNRSLIDRPAAYRPAFINERQNQEEVSPAPRILSGPSPSQIFSELRKRGRHDKRGSLYNMDTYAHRRSRATSITVIPSSGVGHVQEPSSRSISCCPCSCWCHPFKRRSIRPCSGRTSSPTADTRRSR